jgi:DNA-binding PadR family transcriptional regulator
MAVKNKTRYAILGVLNLKPASGYDIKKFCDGTISHFWNENFGHIYPVLSQLQKEGLIKPDNSEVQERRKIYSITDKGKMELVEWLLQPVEFQPQRSELLLKISLGVEIPKEKIVEMLENVKARYISRIKEYRTMELSYVNDEKAQKHPQYPYWLAPLRYGIIAAEAAVQWCDETIENISRHSV